VSTAAARAAKVALSQKDFAYCRAWLFEATAIDLPDHKRSLVESRLIKRLQARGLDTYGEYFRLIEREDEAAERQLCRDLLTTNETSFFREPKHFDFMRAQVLPPHARERPFRVWSAASSSGEEPYTIAMELGEQLGFDAPWDVLGSDISARVLDTARRATYSMARANLPRGYLEKYFLKGIADQAGLVRVQRRLRARVRFASIPLHAALPSIGPFEVVFLRNVLIYFTLATRQQVLRRIEPLLVPNGYLFVSHSESLQGLEHGLIAIQPSIYRKPA
jgi:chemotaxis protein methyltransferase CheR